MPRPPSLADTAKRATRVWSQLALEQLVPALPELIGGSADLTGSNGTKTKHHERRRAGHLRRQLHPLRRARARHGRRDERPRPLRRPHPVRRHVPRVHRLLPRRDPPLRADEAARHLRLDARFDRPRRGWPDAPAGRASGGTARHAEPAGVASGRWRRDGRVLGDRDAADASPRCWPCRARRSRTCASSRRTRT